MKKIINGKILLVVILLCSFSWSGEALSVHIRQPKEDEIQLSKTEYVQLHLAALGYKNEPKSLSRFLLSHNVEELNGIDLRKQRNEGFAIMAELRHISQLLEEAYFWQGNLNFLGMSSSSGFFWVRVEDYRVQCLLNELGYQAGKPDGERNFAYEKALLKFSKDHALKNADFIKVLEKLQYEADKNVENITAVALITIARRSGPWVMPETNPIVKKEYAAGLYLSALGYLVDLTKDDKKDDRGGEFKEIKVRNLKSLLIKFQTDNPNFTQSEGILTNKVLDELSNEFREKYLWKSSSKVI